MLVFSHLLEDLEPVLSSEQFMLLLMPFCHFSDALLIEELNLTAVGIVSFSGWRHRVIILRCNNGNAVCHDGAGERVREEGEEVIGHIVRER